MKTRDRFTIFYSAIPGPDVRLARSSRDRQFRGRRTDRPLRSLPTCRADVPCRAVPGPALRRRRSGAVRARGSDRRARHAGVEPARLSVPKDRRPLGKQAAHHRVDVVGRRRRRGPLNEIRSARRASCVAQLAGVRAEQHFRGRASAHVRMAHDQDVSNMVGYPLKRRVAESGSFNRPRSQRRCVDIALMTASSDCQSSCSGRRPAPSRSAAHHVRSRDTPRRSRSSSPVRRGCGRRKSSGVFRRRFMPSKSGLLNTFHSVTITSASAWSRRFRVVLREVRRASWPGLPCRSSANTRRASSSRPDRRR